MARVVARASGIPAERVGEAERERLALLECRLAQEVVGQEKAVAAVAAAIRRSRTGLGEPGRPIGALLFLGPTGVGKTALSSIRRPTRWPGCWARRRAIWATTKAAS